MVYSGTIPFRGTPISGNLQIVLNCHYPIFLFLLPYLHGSNRFSERSFSFFGRPSLGYFIQSWAIVMCFLRRLFFSSSIDLGAIKLTSPNISRAWLKGTSSSGLYKNTPPEAVCQCYIPLYIYVDESKVIKKIPYNVQLNDFGQTYNTGGQKIPSKNDQKPPFWLQKHLEIEWPATTTWSACLVHFEDILPMKLLQGYKRGICNTYRKGPPVRFLGYSLPHLIRSIDSPYAQQLA